MVVTRIHPISYTHALLYPSGLVPSSQIATPAFTTRWLRDNLMDPVGTSMPPADFHGVRLNELRRAIDLYLAIAYEDGKFPDSVRKRLDWDVSRDPGELLTHAPFEKVGKGASGCPIVALRLGNARYPHMKLQIQTWQSADGFLLSVNTHDQVLTSDPNSLDATASRTLQVENQRIKERIETAWDRAGLPTFHRFLRDYIAANAHPNEAV